MPRKVLSNERISKHTNFELFSIENPCCELVMTTNMVDIAFQFFFSVGNYVQFVYAGLFSKILKVVGLDSQ